MHMHTHKMHVCGVQCTCRLSHHVLLDVCMLLLPSESMFAPERVLLHMAVCEMTGLESMVQRVCPARCMASIPI